jgi:rsbT antagonist protein RsbS
MTDSDRLPVINVWNHVLVPLQGEISDAIAERLVDPVLDTFRDTGAEGLIIDLTGIWMVDSHLCAVLSRLAASARLMGAHSIMCGMNAQVAITLQTMGIDMDAVRTALTLEEAFKSLGIGRIQKKRAAKRGLGGSRLRELTKRTVVESSRGAMDGDDRDRDDDDDRTRL